MLRRLLLLGSWFWSATLLMNCKLPFATEATDDQDLFTVTIDYQGQRIIYPTPITLQWTEVTIENFKEFLIERATIVGAETRWLPIAHVDDSLATTYTDTIADDQTLQYRVRIYNREEHYRYAISEAFTVPEVSVLHVPSEYRSLQEAYNT
jgi:hypothetical protein